MVLVAGLPEKMRECTVCGLTFLSGDICPGCGSHVYQIVTSEGNDENETDATIPGMDSFIETSSAIIPENEDEEEFEEIPSTTLPFGMGGDSVTMKSTLPFGVGSHSLPFTASEHEYEQPSEITETTSELEEIDDVNENASESIIDEPQNTPAAPILPDVFHEEEISNESAVEPISLPSVTEPIEVSEIEPESFIEGIETHEEDDVVIHDFSDDKLTTEVEVDLDNLVEYSSSGDIFNPVEMEAAAEPELHPIKALAVEGLSDPILLEKVQEGFLAMASSNWELAAQEFHTVANSGFGGAAALNNYGLALLQRAIDTFESGDGVQKALVEGQFEAAIFALRQAAQSEGQPSEILYNLGIALHRAAWYDKAMVVFDALLERDGPVTSVLNAKAVLLESRGDFEAAKKLLHMAIRESPDDEISRSNLKRLVPI